MYDIKYKHKIPFFPLLNSLYLKTMFSRLILPFAFGEPKLPVN